jgi:hypothetical protein
MRHSAELRRSATATRTKNIENNPMQCTKGLLALMFYREERRKYQAYGGALAQNLPSSCHWDLMVP